VPAIPFARQNHWTRQLSGVAWTGTRAGRRARALLARARRPARLRCSACRPV